MMLAEEEGGRGRGKRLTQRNTFNSYNWGSKRLQLKFFFSTPFKLESAYYNKGGLFFVLSFLFSMEARIFSIFFFCSHLEAISKLQHKKIRPKKVFSLLRSHFLAIPFVLVSSRPLLEEIPSSSSSSSPSPD